MAGYIARLPDSLSCLLPTFLDSGRDCMYKVALLRRGVQAGARRQPERVKYFAEHIELSL